MSEKILKDIRYYESNSPNVSGNSLPSNIGIIFNFSSSIKLIGIRLARKLNEYKWSFGIADHIYINLTTQLSCKQIHISSRNAEKWIQYIDCYCDPDLINSYSDSQKETYICELTVKVLKELCKGNSERIGIIERVNLLYKEFGTDLQIKYKTKETKKYIVEICYSIGVRPYESIANIKIIDKNSNSIQLETFKLQFFDDIYTLFDEIVFKSNVLVIKPKKSYKAELNNNSYQTPIIYKVG